jgi:hypothetical protein
MFRYQWRAFWRRVLRTRRIRFYLTALTGLGWMAAVALPDTLSRASRELAAGQTASMDRLLLALGLLWFVVLGENLNVSVTSDRLRRFPVGARSLLALRLVSVFLSPIAWLAAIGSMLALAPLLSSRHPLLGGVAAVWFLGLTIGVGLSVSALVSTARWGKGTRAAAAALGVVAVALGLISMRQGAVPSVASLMPANPAMVVTTVAVATAPRSIALSLATLLVGGVAVSYLVLWTFRRSLHHDTTERPARRDTSIGRLPGRLGPLVDKEQRAFSRVLDLWMGLLLVLAVVTLSASTSLPAGFSQTIVVIVCALNANVTLNCLGLDRPAGLTRYLMLPVRGADLLLAKNVALMIVVAVQLAPLLAIGAWQSGVTLLEADLLLAIVLVLAHLAWGNVVSVYEPRRMEPHRFASAGDLLTTSVSVLIGSAPGVAVFVVLRSDSGVAPVAIAVIVLVMAAAYVASLRYAGRIFDRRFEIIRERLA